MAAKWSWLIWGCALLDSARLAQAGTPTFRLEQVGPEPQERPTITNVQIVDLDGDGPPEIIACDAQRQAVFAYRRTAAGQWSEQLLGEGLIAPAHATVVDLDKDGDRDVVVSVMGNLFPDDDVVGSLVLLENVGGSASGLKFTKRVLLEDVRRVVDAQPGDFDGDGDVDLAVAVFGYLRGEVLWLENRGELQFRDHQLHAAAGTIHVPVADYDGDGDLDIAAVVSQEDEEVWGFENTGGGKFTSRRLWMTVNFDIGTAGLVAADLDGDRDLDFLLPVGDNLEDSYSLPQPYHGCLWLENQGGWKFAAQRIATFPGTYAAAASDLDSDGDQDVALVSMVNHWDEPDAPSLVWLENDGQQKFTQRAIAADPIMLVTVACGDATGDGRPDIVAGGLHVYPPFDRLGRISLWTAAGGDGAAPSTEQASLPGTETAVDGPPLPDLNMLDALTRRDLVDLHQRVANKMKSGGDATDDWMLLGQAYYAYGFFVAATECFQHAAEKSPESAYAPFLVGIGLERTGQLPEAIEQFRGMLATAAEKSKRSIWNEMGRCYLRLENARSAEDCFVNAGPHPPSLIQLAKLLIQADRAQEAAGPLNALAELQPRTVELFLLNARAAEAMGNTKLARTFRERAEYNSQRVPADAIAQLVEQVRAQYGAFKLGESATKLINEKKWEEAAAALREDFAASQNRGAAFHLADVELHRGRPELAIALLEDLNAKRGTFPPALVVLGDAHLAAGRPERAEQCWLEAAALYPAGEPHARLATFYEKAGRKDDARRQRALTLEASGVAKLRLANPSQALRDLEAAVELDPALPRAWFYLGECRRFTGNAAGAKAAYETTLQHAPNHGRAIAALKLLAE